MSNTSPSWSTARHRYIRSPAIRTTISSLDAEMVAIARAIIGQRTGSFDPAAYRDRYQEALRELIEAKMKGLTVKPREMAAPPAVIDLMAALKRSLAQEAPASKRLAPAPRKSPDAAVPPLAHSAVAQAPFPRGGGSAQTILRRHGPVRSCPMTSGCGVSRNPL